MVTPTPDGDIQPSKDNQEPESELGVLEEANPQPEDEPGTEPTVEVPEPPATIVVTAWLGHIASLPEGSQYDDFVIL